jgi:hypothetical protein
MSQEKSSGNPPTGQPILNLGAWLGRHQAFSLIATRCTAADAECLKTIRDSGEYKQLDLTWEQFCAKHAGVSRVYADRQIHCLEEFGTNYFRMAEVMPISRDTYRLIAGSVTDEGLASGGERIPLVRENRDKVAAAVTSMRAKGEAGRTGSLALAPVRQRLQALLTAAEGMAKRPGSRPELIAVLQEGGESLHHLASLLREKMPASR